MICPQCGNNNPEGSKICSQCGFDLLKYRETHPGKPKIGRIIRTILTVILFTTVMFLCQSCVISGYTASLMLGSGYMGIDASVLSEETLTGMLIDITEKVNSQTVLILLISNLLTILVICLLFRLMKKKPMEEMNVRYVNPFRIPTFALLGAALNVFVSVTISFIPFPESIVEAFNTQYSSMYGGNLALEVLSIAVVTGITEELVFRGIAMKRLVPAVGKWGAIIISAVIFGLAHGTPIAILYATALGVLFGYICSSYHSVSMCIVCHVFFNLTSYLLPADNDRAMLALYIMSIAVIVFCVYRAFIRRPTFYDLVFDKNGDYEFINETERELIERVRTARNSDDIDMTPDELEEVFEAWEKNRENNKYKTGRK